MIMNKFDSEETTYLNYLVISVLFTMISCNRKAVFVFLLLSLSSLHGVFSLVYPSGNFSEVTGKVQRKPGRGDATLSVSCSDKITR